MVTKTKIDSEDLLQLENKINKEQTEYRHWLRSDMQKVIIEVDDFKDKLIAVWIKQEYISKAISELSINLKEHMRDEEANMKIFSNSIEKAFKDLSRDIKSEYATKIEHQQNKVEIWELKNLLKWTLWWIIVFVFGALWTAIMNVILK